MAVPGSANALTHSDVWKIKGLPSSVAVVSAAATGCQLASVFAAFGSRVRLLDVAPRILGGEDAAVSRGLGAHNVGEQAVEVAQPAAAAMRAGMPVEQLAGLELAYPTFTSVVGLAARQIIRDLDPTSPRRRREPRDARERRSGSTANASRANYRKGSLLIVRVTPFVTDP